MPRLKISKQILMVVAMLAMASSHASDICMDPSSLQEATAKQSSANFVPTREALAVREFALHAYRRIAIDILNRRGMYLDALTQMLQLPCSSPDFTQWLELQLRESRDAVEFSRRLMATKLTVQYHADDQPITIRD